MDRKLVNTRKHMDDPLTILDGMKDDICHGNEDSFREAFLTLARLGVDRRELVEEHYLLHKAAEKDSLSILNLLLSLRPDVNSRDHEGKTALHSAANSRAENAPMIVAALVRVGADVNLRDGRQRPPLHLALSIGAAQNAITLIDAGAEVNAIVPTFGAPIHLVLNFFQEFRTSKDAGEVIFKLLAAGADPNARDNHDRTPLHMVHKGELQIVTRLLEAGGDPNAKDWEGNTPLHNAANNRDKKLAECFYNAGANPTAVNRFGMTPETIAASGRWDRIHSLVKSPRTMPKPRPLFVYQPARPFEPHAERREVCKKLRSSIWYLGMQTTSNETSKESVHDDPHESHLDSYQLAEGAMEDLTPWQVTRPLTRTYLPTVYDMLYGDALGKASLDMSSGGFRWFHLPYTIRLWVDHLIDAIRKSDSQMNPSGTSMSDSADIKRFILETFNETGLVARHRQPGFVFENCSREKQKLRRASSVVSELIDPAENQIGQRASLVLPLVDVDYSVDEKKRLEDEEVGGPKDGCDNHRKHIHAMKDLGSSYKDCKPHFPRTLDESNYDFLEPDDLKSRDQNQVLTAFLIGRKAIAESGASTSGLKPCNIRQGSTPSEIVIPEGNEGVVEGSRCQLMQNSEPGMPSARTDLEDDPIRLQMLMVSQLWLWKIDHCTIISAFPERWDSRYGQSMFDKVRSEIQSAATVDDLIFKIACSCIKYIEDSWYVSEGKGYTTFDAFDHAIADVSNEVSKCYERFEKSVRSSNKHIQLEVQKGAGLLKKISDVMDEIGIIKRALNDQAAAMNSIQQWRPRVNVSDNYVHYPLERFTRLEQNARSVRDSLITLLDIWQRESMIDEAQEESRQSRVIFVFTTITVCFLPLSFIGQLLALPIRGFENGDKYNPGWVFEVEVITMVTTLILLIPLFWMCFGLPEIVKKIWKCFSPSTSRSESSENKASGPNDRGNNRESQQSRVALSSLLRSRLCDRRQSETQRDPENGPGRVGRERSSIR
ncbi:uncharacterized protein BO88DRAFT_449065 [Aspergillus vadensis CBS 113365]|uniref:Uncharacterized protein n=1 Tax=Aspergillus vadensis (strain CBS 113365 / IMI 142717 / IBT 24658) TaxID=1448311 RepID=A0A319BPT1_ASPVC|nr:hypothetical protein BO88DRAFT_449065 [Aspergillus vadensis CBS 113365]PYH73180.1 hypothetical protein BO88DRAFT_449065 [Aspergillus vadensis CBS 113365]